MTLGDCREMLKAGSEPYWNLFIYLFFVFLSVSLTERCRNYVTFSLSFIKRLRNITLFSMIVM